MHVAHYLVTLSSIRSAISWHASCSLLSLFNDLASTVREKVFNGQIMHVIRIAALVCCLLAPIAAHAQHDGGKSGLELDRHEILEIRLTMNMVENLRELRRLLRHQKKETCICYEENSEPCYSDPQIFSVGPKGCSFFNELELSSFPKSGQISVKNF